MRSPEKSFRAGLARGLLLLAVGTFACGGGASASAPATSARLLPSLPPGPTPPARRSLTTVTAAPDPEKTKLFVARFLLAIERTDPKAFDSLSVEARFRSTESNRERWVRAALETSFQETKNSGRKAPHFAFETLKVGEGAASPLEIPEPPNLSYVVDYELTPNSSDGPERLVIVVVAEEGNLRIRWLESKTGAL